MAFKVDAVHPGYGFLSENADFAALCEKKGVVFIGPASDVISRMGDKIEAKKIARRAGVPNMPGSLGAIAEYSEALDVAGEVGYPLPTSAGGRTQSQGRRGSERVPWTHHNQRIFENFRS